MIFDPNLSSFECRRWDGHYGRIAHTFHTPKNDVNIVIRVDRSSDSPQHITTYINGQSIATTESFGPELSELQLNEAAVGATNEQHSTLANVVLTVFHEQEKEQVAVFAEAMRNPEVAIAKKVLAER
jgi:hypothetical protein